MKAYPQPAMTWKNTPIWLRVVGILAITNFASFWIIAVLNDGDALNGKEEAGRYFVNSHGRYTEVSKAFYDYSLIHGSSVLITHPAAIMAFFWYVYYGRKAMPVEYKQAERSDIPAMARVRAAEWESEAYWNVRISRYLDCEHNPQEALMPRVIYVASEGGFLVGFIAGHLTRRHACDGELEWINVIPERRGSVIASELLGRLAGWFVEHNASRICVDVDPNNIRARSFYRRHGAETLKPHWLVWNDIKVVLDRP
jgi:ribosomal protein S18 acetylase RimI-like enzyme